MSGCSIANKEAQQKQAEERNMQICKSHQDCVIATWSWHGCIAQMGINKNFLDQFLEEKKRRREKSEIWNTL